MPDLFGGTEDADNRTEIQREFNLLSQYQDEFRNNNQFSIDGLPLFSLNEREARITKQFNIFHKEKNQ